MKKTKGQKSLETCPKSYTSVVLKFLSVVDSDAVRY